MSIKLTFIYFIIKRLLTAIYKFWSKLYIANIYKQKNYVALEASLYILNVLIDLSLELNWV